MNEVNFRLESFSAPVLPDPGALRQDELDSAYRRGLAEGRAMGFSDELRSLTEAFRAHAAMMSDGEAIQLAAARHAVADILPILSQIVTALAGTSQAAGLEAAIAQEFRRLAAQPAPVTWHVLCPAGMEAMIRRCAQTAGIDQPDIRIGADCREASIVMNQGRSAFSDKKVAGHFRDLISELQESYR